MVDDQSSIFRQKSCKLMERMTNIFQVLEEVQMIFFNVQNNPDCREEMKKTIRVLTGFRDKCFGFPTRIFPPIAWRIPPTEIVGSTSPSSKM